MNLLRNTYGNTTLMIDKTKNKLGKAAWHDFTASQEVIRLLPKLNRIIKKTQKNNNKDDIWSDYTLSSSYVICFLKGIY